MPAVSESVKKKLPSILAEAFKLGLVIAAASLLGLLLKLELRLGLRLRLVFGLGLGLFVGSARVMDRRMVSFSAELNVLLWVGIGDIVGVRIRTFNKGKEENIVSGLQKSVRRWNRTKE